MPKKYFVLVFLLALAGWLLISKRSTTPEAARLKRLAAAGAANDLIAAVPTNHPILATTNPPATSTPLIGETILRGYATATSTPENDLTLMAHLLENFCLLVKSASDRPLSANEDWAAALRGQNPARERFLPDQHAAFNARGQLVDRWQTPLFFHALGNHQFEIRSAGPDKKLWTADDLHRNADGSFRRGAALNAPSLFESAPR